jgi:hypothetical protein
LALDFILNDVPKSKSKRLDFIQLLAHMLLHCFYNKLRILFVSSFWRCGERADVRTWHDLYV